MNDNYSPLLKGRVRYTGYWFIEYEDYWIGDNRIELIKKEAPLPLLVDGWHHLENQEISFRIEPETGQAIPYADEEIPTEPSDKWKPLISHEELAAELAYKEINEAEDFFHHSDKDIWISGFKAGYKYMQEKQTDKGNNRAYWI